jgi:hypothetical protein
MPRRNVSMYLTRKILTSRQGGRCDGGRVFRKAREGTHEHHVAAATETATVGDYLHALPTSGVKMIVRLLVQLVVAAMASRIVGGVGEATHGAEAGKDRKSTPRTSTRSASHRDLVLGPPTGGGKYPFLVIVAWEDLVSDPRVRIS